MAPPVVAAATEPATDLRDEVRSLHRKLDRLADQVAYMHERTRAAVELRDDLVPVVKDMVAALTDELVSIEHEFNSNEVAALVRKTLGSTRRLCWALDQLEKVSEFVEEFTPIAKDLMNCGIESLDKAERRGFFRLAQGAGRLADQIYENFSQEDIDALVRAFPTILQTLKQLTQPSALEFATAAVNAITSVRPETATPVSMWGMLRAMREPAVQRSLGMTVDILRGLSAPPPPSAGLLTAGKANGNGNGQGKA